MSNVLEENLKVLREYHPDISNKLDAYIEGRYTKRYNAIERIVLARQDEMVINMLVFINGQQYLLYDHDNPIYQAYSWIDSYIDPSNSIDIVFGMGFGFHLNVLITSFKNKNIILIEPDIELFYQILKVRDVKQILEKCEIFVDEYVDSILEKTNRVFWDKKAVGIELEPFGVYADMFEELWSDFRNKFMKQAQSFTVDINTRRHFGELWTHNYVKNCLRLSRASNSEGLIGKFKGIPGILVSAGPSLSKNVQLLKGVEDKCVIMAAGTAVNILEKYDVKPHFMVGIDASESEAEIHRKVKNRDIYFIYSNQVATGSLTYYQGPKFFMNYTADQYSAQFLNFAGIKSTFFLSGPSVSNTCFDLLYKMGCNPIIIVGQDLAYTSGQLYAGEEKLPAFEQESDNNKNEFIREKDIYGNDIFTSLGFIGIRNWFEGIFKKAADTVEIINATEGGLNIEYSRNDSLSNVINKGNFKSPDINNMIKNIYKEYAFKENVNAELEKYMQFIMDEIEKLDGYSKDQLRLVNLIKRDVYHPEKNRKIFERTVNSINSLSDMVIGSPIYYPILRNLIEIEFFLISRQVDLTTGDAKSYDQAKEVYLNGIIEQNKILNERLAEVKKILK